VNCGAKLTIIRDYPFAAEMHNYNGLFLSNGPGDPTMCKETIAQLEKVISCPDNQIKPIFGFCLGNQLVGWPAAGTAKKLPFGHRGQNQPVLNHQTGECYITIQNHGYVIECSTLRPGWKSLFTKTNDGLTLFHRTILPRGSLWTNGH
jgi:carbamoyl-phosphate synthase (ammonia)